MIKLVRKWWSAWGTLPVVSWVKAAAYYKAGQFEVARRYYERGLAKYPQHPAADCARLDLSYCLFRTREFIAAEKHLRLVLSSEPENKEASIRLARLHLWTGNFVEAAWTVRRALSHVAHDVELVSLLVIAAVENSGPSYMLSAAHAELALLDQNVQDTPILLIAKARLALYDGNVESAMEYLEPVLRRSSVPFDAYVVQGQILLEQERVAHARKALRKALQLAPDNPRVLCLLSRSYLIAGPLYEPEYACQLATAAAQNSSWLSPWAMHLLAEAYYHCGDNMSALILAGKAKEVGSQLLGTYKDAVSLEMLIESLNSADAASKS